jgi:hypothetical protein
LLKPVQTHDQYALPVEVHCGGVRDNLRISTNSRDLPQEVDIPDGRLQCKIESSCRVAASR